MRRVDAVRIASGVLLGLLSIGADGGLFDQATRVAVRLEPRFDFAEPETYQWHPEQRIETELDEHLKVVVAVQRRMSALGYRIDVHEPDLHIRYRFEVGKTEVPVTRREPPVFECTDDDCEEEAWAYLVVNLIAAMVRDNDRTIEHLELTITLLDAETNWEVFSASGVFPWSEDEADWILTQAVRELLEQLPPAEGG
jgi:hypothetical protein